MNKLFQLSSMALAIALSTTAVTSSHAAISSDPAQVQLFVKWRTENLAERERLRNELGLREVWTSTLVSGLKGYRLDSTQDRDQLVKSLAHDLRVVYAEPNFKVRRHLPKFGKTYSATELASIRDENTAPNDPMLNRQWALTTEKGVHAIEAWGTTQGSSEIRVAVIDTGVDKDHPDLAGRVLPGYDFIGNTDQVRDTHGHGTHVSGIIGAISNNGVGVAGINPNVSILPIRAVPNDDDETDANVISAFEFAVRNGARVANCSFGKAKSSQAVADTIVAAGQAGLLVVVAAGNDGRDNNSNEAFPANFHTENMIVVASIGQSGSLSFFSNFGLGLVDVAAPGGNIMSTVAGGRYSSMSGTSMAAPQVAGVAALTLSANPQLTVAQLKAILLNTAVKDSVLTGKVDTGARIDAAMAVAAAHNTLLNPENP